MTPFLLFLFAYCSPKTAIEKRIFKIVNASKEAFFEIKLKKRFNYQRMQILENTLNDTCMIGIMKMPPGKLGVLYRVEFLSDSISYNYSPYKATSGTLIIKHSFMDY